MEVFSWKDVKPNNVRIDVRMLISDHVLNRSCFLKGQDFKTDKPEKRFIQYDEKYVIMTLVSVLKPFKQLGEENFKKLMEKVFFQLKNDESN